MRWTNTLASESDEQRAFFQYVRIKAMGIPVYENIFSIPNGAHLAGDKEQRARHMKRLKAEGLSPGVCDIFAAIPIQPYSGLFIEMKRKGNLPTIAQVNWKKRLEAVGYAVSICYSADEAIQTLERYLRSENTSQEVVKWKE